MIIIENEKIVINKDEEIIRISNFVDNTKKTLYYDDNCDLDFISTQMTIQKKDRQCEVILVSSGGVSGLHDSCYVVDNRQLIICVGDSLFSLRTDDLVLNWAKKMDLATCFQVFNFNNGYIVHGELEITYLDYNGNINWKFSGRDIFVTSDGIDEFKIADNKIYLLDWGKNEYVLDQYGNLLM